MSAANTTSTSTTATIRTQVGPNLVVTGVDGASRTGLTSVAATGVALSGAKAGVPSIAPATQTPGGYLPLEAFGIAPVPVGDEAILNYTVPEFVYAGETYTSLAVDSNGYLVVGGGTAEDNDCCSPVIPATSRPNNVLAPLWTDLTGEGAEGVRIATLTDGVNTWIVAQWNVFTWGTTTPQTFQVWIGTNASEDISFTYDPANLPTNPGDQPLVVGAENRDGTGGQALPDGTLPTSDLRVTSTDPTPGAAVSYTVRLLGLLPGTGQVTSTLTSPVVPGTTRVSTPVRVVRR